MQPFAYARPADAASAVAAARSRGETPNRAPAQYLAGGTNLLDLMKLDVAQPSLVVDINMLVRDHGRIEANGPGLRLGALVRMSEAQEHPAVKQNYPVIAQSLQQAASQQLRNMASLGGNVLQRTRCQYFRDTSWPHCNRRNPGSGCAALDGVNRKHAVLGVSDHCIASYPGDFAQALVALDARADILGSGGVRSIKIADLHRLPGDAPHIETNLRPGDLILGFDVPAGPWTRRSLYLKIRDRASYEFAICSAAVALDMDGAIVREARIALGGVATKPWRSHEAEGALRGRMLDGVSAQEAAEAAFLGALGHGQNDYKPELGRRTLVRALLRAKAMEV